MVPTPAQLQLLCTQLNDIPNINKGGCCVVAATVANHMQHLYPTRIRVSNDWYTNDDTPIDQVASSLDEPDDLYCWNDNGIDFGHVFVEFEYKGHTYFIDSNGVTLAGRTDPTYNWIVYNGELPLKLAKRLIYSEGWNTKFNRTAIPKVKKLINKFFVQFKTA